MTALLDDFVVRAALAGIYTQGEAGLALHSHERVLASVDSAVGAVIHEQRLRHLYALLRNASAEPGEERQEIPPELDLDLAARAIARIMPVMIPGMAWGSTIRLIVCHLLPPQA